MRVITGTAKGTNLKAPDGVLTRPTADRAKVGLFNIIQFDICGAVLDLFGGTGQLGIECLSRGAAHAVFVDGRKEAADLICENLHRTRLQDKARVVCMDYMDYLNCCKQKFHLIFLDPPYAEKYLENALKRISEIDILEENGIIVTERPVEKTLEGTYNGLVRSKDYKYGKTFIALFRKEPNIP